MKKLMIDASAALCATVGLCIESANVVGYQNKGVTKNLSQQVCTFDAVGGGGLELAKLVPVDDEGEYVGEGEVSVQFYSGLGVLEGGYSYYGAGEYGKKFPNAGWYDEDADELIEDFQFDSGEGFMTFAGTPCKFVYSGEVNMAETDVPFRKNLSPQGNIRPSSVDIQDIVPVDGEGDYIGEGEITIQFYSGLGVLEGGYSYYGPGEYGKKFPNAGWYDEDNDELADYTFAAGEGFLLFGGQAGYLRFPEL